MRTMLLIAVFLASGQLALAQETFSYPVMRDKTLHKDEPGQLQIDDSSVTFASKDGKSFIRIPLQDIYEADVSNPSIIQIETYDVLKQRLGGRQIYKFRLVGVTNDQALARFLTQHLKRPTVASYTSSAKPDYSIRAYHKRAAGGSNGTLEIGPDGIQFFSQKSDDSRTWRYEDIETVGRSDAFNFRVSTLAETFSFDLKDKLSDQAYESVWRRVYQLPQKYAGKDK